MDLEQHRSDASIQSLGSSSDLIIDAFVEKFLAQNFPKDVRILDVGCGQGHLLGKIKAHGYENLTGCDYTDFSDRGMPFHFFQQDCNQPFPSDLGAFDIILSSEVIEHLENPWQFIRHLKAQLKEGGTLMLSTPNPESLLSLLSLTLKGYYSSFGPREYPAHITPVCVWEMGNILTQAKFEAFHFHFIPNGRMPGSALRWNQVFPFLSGKRFSDNYLVMAK